MMRVFAIISLGEYSSNPAMVNLVDHTPQLMTAVISILSENTEAPENSLNL